MKIPIWAKTKKGRYEVFPIEMLKTFEDGSRGFEDVTPFSDDCSCTLCIMYGKFGQHFKIIDIKGKESSLVKRFILKE